MERRKSKRQTFQRMPLSSVLHLQVCDSVVAPAGIRSALSNSKSNQCVHQRNRATDSWQTDDGAATLLNAVGWPVTRRWCACCMLLTVSCLWRWRWRRQQTNAHTQLYMYTLQLTAANQSTLPTELRLVVAANKWSIPTKTHVANCIYNNDKKKNVSSSNRSDKIKITLDHTYALFWHYTAKAITTYKIFTSTFSIRVKIATCQAQQSKQKSKTQMYRTKLQSCKLTQQANSAGLILDCGNVQHNL